MTLTKPLRFFKPQVKDIRIKNLIGTVKSIVKAYAPRAVTIYHLLSKSFPRTELWQSLLSKLNAKTSDVFFVEIGAMDGVSFDPLYQHVVANGWRGLLVEPLDDMFHQLKKAYQNQKGLIFENVAIADAPGTKKMYRVSLEAVEKGLVPHWAKGISSFFEDRNEIGGMGVSGEVFKKIQPHVVSEIVRCETLNNLLLKHDIRKIDVLQIDVEGYDYNVLKQLDFLRFSPRIIRMEWSVLSPNERQQTLDLLKIHKYRTLILAEDIIAWRGFGIFSGFTHRIRSLVSNA
jgi:FkbM family methyltransferase